MQWILDRSLGMARAIVQLTERGCFIAARPSLRLVETSDLPDGPDFRTLPQPQDASRRENRLRGESDFASHIKVLGAFKRSAQKYSCFYISEIMIDLRCSAPARGAYASSRTWSGMRWTG
jgi:hypothetical protein